MYEETRIRLWKDLPVKLGLGNWDDFGVEEIFAGVPNGEWTIVLCRNQACRLFRTNPELLYVCTLNL